ncbi:MAG TPA: hypothetical protein VIX87_13410, partial [Steroidobacteraceae bacterium]
GNGGITLQNAGVAVAALDPGKAFGSSAAGPLQFRVSAGGVTGDWQPLATLVRLPEFKELKCPVTPELACKLAGANLFLVDSISTDARFDHPVQVPDGFPGTALPVPHPAGPLYVKLRDDPAVISTVALNVEQLPPSSNEVARAAERHAAAHIEETSSASSSAQSAPPAPSAPPPAPATVAPPASAPPIPASAPASAPAPPAASPAAPPAASPTAPPAAAPAALPPVPPSVPASSTAAPPSSLSGPASSAAAPPS